MTDEELQQAIQEISESLDNLPESDEKVPARHRALLLSKKETLQKIKEAREKGDNHQELYNSVCYSLLNSWGEKHPYWVHLMMSKFMWSGFH